MEAMEAPVKTEGGSTVSTIKEFEEAFKSAFAEFGLRRSLGKEQLISMAADLLIKGPFLKISIEATIRREFFDERDKAEAKRELPAYAISDVQGYDFVQDPFLERKIVDFFQLVNVAVLRKASDLALRVRELEALVSQSVDAVL